MAILRLVNGTDLTVTLTVEETVSALDSKRDYVQLPSEDGPVHIRPSGVIAIVEDSRRRASGFRISSESGTR